MKLYQICVKGWQAYFNSEFRAYSRQVWKNRKPTEQEIEKFIKNCSDETRDPIYVLDTKQEHTVKILELELVED